MPQFYRLRIVRYQAEAVHHYPPGRDVRAGEGERYAQWAVCLERHVRCGSRVFGGRWTAGRPELELGVEVVIGVLEDGFEKYNTYM